MATYMDTLKNVYGGFWEFEQAGMNMDKLKVFHKLVLAFVEVNKTEGFNFHISPHFILRATQSSFTKEFFEKMLNDFKAKYCLKNNSTQVEVYPAADNRLEAKEWYGKWFLVFKDHGYRIDLISSGIPGERKKAGYAVNSMSNESKKEFFTKKNQYKKEKRKDNRNGKFSRS